MGTGHREVEDSYDVDTDTAPPPLVGRWGIASVTEPVEHLLEATYFDTDDLALAAAGVTLRRRTGGADAGWHLKLPVTGGRQELHRPLGRARVTVPKPLRETVRTLTRDRRLQPVATVINHRIVRHLLDDDGRVLAEVADDRVDAETPPGPTRPAARRSWREWEVELVEGGPELLAGVGEAWTAAGARPAAVPSKLARALGERLPPRPAVAHPRPGEAAGVVLRARLAEQLAAVRRNDPLVRAGMPDAVHDLRVALRRLREALATHRPLLDRSVTDPLRTELRWLASSLGTARDAEVQRERLLRLLAEVSTPEHRDAVRVRVERYLAARAERGREQSHAALGSDRYDHLLDALDRLVADPPLAPLASRPAEEVLPDRVRHDWKRLRKRVRAAGDQTDPARRAASWHEARKAAKRARYSAEVLVPLLGKPARRYVKALRRLQTALGDHHDAVVAQPVLRELADAATAAGENAFTYGELHRRESETQAAAEQRVERAWKRASRRSRRGWPR